VCPQVPSDDPLLVHWVKEPAPFIGLPPPNMNLTGWRDPFVVERPCETNDWEWIVLMGSGAWCRCFREHVRHMTQACMNMCAM
jgi:hypothetical protein